MTARTDAAHRKNVTMELIGIFTVLVILILGDEGESGLSVLGSMLGKGIAGLAIDNMLEENNHFVCSIGAVTYERKTKVASTGVLNHAVPGN